MDTKQLTPRIRLEHVNCGDVWRWVVTVDKSAPEHFISHSEAIMFARGVDIGHACTEEPAMQKANQAQADLEKQIVELKGIIKAAHAQLVTAFDTNERMFVDSARAMLGDALES